MGPQTTFCTQHATHLMQRATYTRTHSIHSDPPRPCPAGADATSAHNAQRHTRTHSRKRASTKARAHTRTASRADSVGQYELHGTADTSRAIIFIDTAASVPEPRPSPVRILTTYAAAAGAKAKADPRRKAELIAAGSARTSGLGDSAVHAIGGGARLIAAGGWNGCKGDWEDSPSAESSSRSTDSSPRCDEAAASPVATCGASSTALATSGSCSLRVGGSETGEARRALVGWYKGECALHGVLTAVSQRRAR